MPERHLRSGTEGLPPVVRIVEVGPRDGLQNEAGFVPTETKVALIERLRAAGIRHIEAAAFVSPKWVPQMADGAEVLRRVRPAWRAQAGAAPVRFAALVPNLKGMAAALEAGCDEVAVFAAASETFSRRNINCSIEESFARFQPIAQLAHANGIALRGYVSCVLGCPFEGRIAPEQVAVVAQRLVDMGCHEVSLGDTIGVGTPAATEALVAACAARVPIGALAGHFHDTWGMAIANIHAAMRCGVATFDSSVAGLGGCPYSPGATGNVATEDVVYLCDGLGVTTGVDFARASEAGEFISAALGRPTSSRAARAFAARRQRDAEAKSTQSRRKADAKFG
ncbi:hydroxymethylglutaryl-CoA lyase [Chitinasiproducens palmae]|uniref:hydroxymethylglutaryl-CoA lyase n=1 Tax=Chitinasiproducens palmae TaxID=1770053 RepID=A0A1H2PQP1_9BURK|nr:hydroxymethylglutaryl-CoA lyase [Chitinasiproducens palmae]SDV48738.1 hydroxymethylglutaryl-CoA lyase [Chitinasiproducens palmae]